jgi:hypothetical protein
MFPNACSYGNFFLFWYMELVSKVCLHLLVTRVYNDDCCVAAVQRGQPVTLQYGTDTCFTAMSSFLNLLIPFRWVVGILVLEVRPCYIPVIYTGQHKVSQLVTAWTVFKIAISEFMRPKTLPMWNGNQGNLNLALIKSHGSRHKHSFNWSSKTKIMDLQVPSKTSNAV